MNDNDIGSLQPSEHRLLPLSHEVSTLHDPITGHPYAAILSDGELLASAPSKVGTVTVIGLLHNVRPARYEPTVAKETTWDGAAPDRHGGYTKGEMLGEYPTTGELYKQLNGPGFKVQANSWSRRMKSLQTKAELEEWFENHIAASEG